MNNQYGHDNPQIHQVQHIAHVQNLQQFSPAYPVQPIYHPNIHNGQPIYFKQNDEPAEKSVLNLIKTIIKPTNSETTTNNIELTDKTENPETDTTKAELMKVETTKVETTKLPSPMNEILAINAARK